MNKKIMAQILSFLLAFSASASGSLIVPAAEQEEEPVITEIQEEEEAAEEIAEKEPEEVTEQTEPELPGPEETAEEPEGPAGEITEPEGPAGEITEPEAENEETGLPEEEFTEETPEGPSEEAPVIEPEEESVTAGEEQEEEAETMADAEAYFYVGGVSVPAEGTGIFNVETEYLTSGSITFDYETKTLTLDNAQVTARGIVDPENMAFISEYGYEELTLRLAGSSMIDFSSVSDYGRESNGINVNSILNITSDDGTGSLDIKASSSSTYYGEIYAVSAIYASKIIISNCKVSAQGTLYAIHGKYGIEFKAGADVTAKITSTGSDAGALHVYADKQYKVAHNPIETDMRGYAAVDDETYTELNQLEYVYDDYGYDEMIKYKKLTVTPREKAGDIVMSGSCGAEGDNITFELTDEGVLTLTGTGAMKDYEAGYYSSSDTAAPWYDRDVIYVSSVVIGEGITHIGNYAFYNCMLLADISLPSTLGTIGRYAFADCDSMNEIVLPDSVTEIGEWSFGSCKNLTAATLSSSLTSIGDAAFYACKKLQGIEIPETVTYIGDAAFEDCTALSGSVTIPAGVTELESTFENCGNLEHVYLNEGLQKLGSLTFYECNKLTEITLPSTLTEIGSGALSYTSLAEITIPQGVETLDSNVFSHCTDLVSVTLPSGLKTIDSYVFWNCTALKNINFPDGLEKIGQQAFENCTSLEEVIIPDSVTVLGSDSFHNCTSVKKVRIGKGVEFLPYMGFSGCTSLTDLTICDGVVYLGRGTFSNCTSLETVVIPDSVINSYNCDSEFSGCTSLKNVTLSANMYMVTPGMFSGCASLEEIVLPEGLNSIGNNAFEYCTALKQIAVPASVYSIGQHAFDSCSSLESIELKKEGKLSSIEYYTFRNCSSLSEITIPDAVKYIADSAFDSCTALEEVSYGGVLKEDDYYRYTVGYNAFRNCTSLTHLEFTAALKNAVIRSGAFTGLAADVVHIYGMPGGTLESNASSGNYTFHAAGFTVRYHANGGEGEMEDQTVDFTGSTEDPGPLCFAKNTFTNGELFFLKWNTKPDGSGRSYEDEAQITIDIPSSGTLELYAQWVKSYDLWIAGKLIHSGNKDDIEERLSNYRASYTPSTYDPETNTLTLNQSFYASNYMDIKEGASPDRYYGLYYPGDRELTIIMKASAEFTGQSSTGLPDIYGLYCGGSLRLVFDYQGGYYTPTMTVNPGTSSGADICAMYVGGNLTISGNGQLATARGYSDCARSIGLRMKGGTIRMQGNALARLACRYGGTEVYGLYLEGNTTLRASNWNGSLEISGYGDSPAVGGSEGAKLLRRGSECDIIGFSTASFSGTSEMLNENSYPVSDLSAYKSIRALPVNHVMMVSLAEPDRRYVYTGAAISPAVLVTCNGAALQEGRDYTVKYANNKAAWELPEGVENDQEGFLSLGKKKLQKAPKITVTGKGNFTGSTVLYFEVEKKNITAGDTAGNTVPVTTTDLTVVSGSKAAPILYYGTYKLTAKDYTAVPKASVKYKEDTIMTVTGKGNFTGTAEIPVKVVPGKADLKNIAVDFGPKILVYNGTDRKEEILGAIKVYDASDKTEKADIGSDHYKLTMSGNTTDAGTVKVTVTGMNGYSGTKTASIKITPNTQIDVKVENYYPNITYTGKAVNGFIGVRADLDGMGEGDAQYETALVEGKDFKVTYKNNTAVSTAKKKGSYTVTFIGDYKGKKAVTGKFDILPAKITNVNLVNNPEKIYTKPGAYASVPIMLYNGKFLKAGTDFTVSYYRSITYSYNEEAGRNVYEFSGPVTSKKGQMITDADFINEGNERDSITIFVKIVGKGNFRSEDPYDFNVSSYTLRKEKIPYSSEETMRYLDLSKATVTLTKKNAAGKTVKVTSFPYTGNSIYFDAYGYGTDDYPAQLTVTYKYDKKTTLTLRSGTDFGISYYNNVNKGTATMILRGYGNHHIFYDDSGQPVKDMKGNEIGRIAFSGTKQSTFKITAGKISELLKKILNIG